MLLINPPSNPDRFTAGALGADCPPAGKPPCSLATLDVSVLEGRRRLERRLGKSVLPAMFDILRCHLPRSCEQMWQALDEDDAVTLGQISHKLKSSARCLGMPRLGDLCAQLEKDAKNSRLRGAEGLLAAIEDEYDRAALALRRFMVQQTATEPTPAVPIAATA